MNKEQLRAMLLIAKKLGWNGKPAAWCINTINDMVTEKQCKELAVHGDCDDYEETLLSLPLQSKRILLDLKHNARETQVFDDAMHGNTDRLSWILNECWS